jgi:L,D-peptidoglycan transpeptidase YkuD (ErfK/YbiS/YcfS/YnhG family)
MFSPSRDVPISVGRVLLQRGVVVAATAFAVAVPAVPYAGTTPPATPATAVSTTTPVAASTSTALPDRLRGVHDARQLVVVTATNYSTSYATVHVYGKHDGAWHLVFGPWNGRIGWRGFARPGDKREGDGQTPSGSYRLPFAFGVDADPGTRLRYRRALDTSRWDDDSSSRNYNRWVDIRYGDPGADPEHMRVLPDYRYGVVIGYNPDRVPGRGSAIFLHVSDGTTTAGCITVGRHRLVRLMRWLRPALAPRAVRGTRAWVTRCPRAAG